MNGWLDRVPPTLRHFLFSLAAICALAGLNWLQSNYTTLSLGPVLEGLIAAAIPLAVAYVTPWTTQYGTGSSASVTADASLPVDAPSSGDSGA